MNRSGHGARVKKLAPIVLAAAMLGGCGVDTATTAATGAAIKKQEMEAGKNTKEQAQQKLDQALQLQEKARRHAEAAAK